MWYKFLVFLFCIGCTVRPLYNVDDKNVGMIDVEVIAEREGQKLREYLRSDFRDLQFVKQRYVLSTTMSVTEKPFAFADDGNAKRVLISYTANIVLKDENRNPIFKKAVSVSMSSNISSAQGEVVLSLYGRNNAAALRELSRRITENIRMFLLNENRI